MAEIRIGTSGWHYKHWAGRFYPARWPASKMLAFYDDRFNTVEVNNSFYRLPGEVALEGLAHMNARGFSFCREGQPLPHAYEEAEGPCRGHREVLRAGGFAERETGSGPVSTAAELRGKYRTAGRISGSPSEVASIRV